MRRITLWIMATLSALVLLLGYRTSTSDALPAAGGTASGGTAGGTATAGAATASSGAGQQFTGSAVQTRYGPVQVRLTVANGTITAVDVPQYPTESRKDQAINAQAIPTLVQETLQAQGAGIDMVSGATYTSTGYQKSLQSALDQAAIG